MILRLTTRINQLVKWPVVNTRFKIILVIIFLVFELSAKAQGVFENKLSSAAIALTKVNATYDPSYFSIAYPGGDVPSDKGVCTDVVIRAYRKLDIDLQKLVHEDMKANFKKYPNRWGLTKTDRNIDHRRVPNLMTFFPGMARNSLFPKVQKITCPEIL